MMVTKAQRKKRQHIAFYVVLAALVGWLLMYAPYDIFKVVVMDGIERGTERTVYMTKEGKLFAAAIVGVVALAISLYHGIRALFRSKQ